MPMREGDPGSTSPRPPKSGTGRDPGVAEHEHDAPDRKRPGCVGVGDRDGGQPVPLPLPGRAPLPHPEPALAAAFGGRGEPTGTRGAAALPVAAPRRWCIRRPSSWAVPSWSRSSPTRTDRSRWPTPGGSCPRSSPAARPPAFDPESPPWPQFAELLAPADGLVLSRPAPTRRRLLPLAPARRRLRADRAAPGPARPGPADRPPHLPADRPPARPLRAPPAPPRHRAGRPRRRHRARSTAASAAP